MRPLDYDEDELIRRLLDCGCKIEKDQVRIGSRGTLTQTFLFERNGSTATLRSIDDGQPLFAMTVASILRRLRLHHEAARFGLQAWECEDERH